MTRFFICLAVIAVIVLGSLVYAATAPLRHVAAVLEQRP